MVLSNDEISGEIMAWVGPYACSGGKLVPEATSVDDMKVSYSKHEDAINQIISVLIGAKDDKLPPIETIFTIISLSSRLSYSNHVPSLQLLKKLANWSITKLDNTFSKSFKLTESKITRIAEVINENSELSDSMLKSLFSLFPQVKIDLQVILAFRILEYSFSYLPLSKIVPPDNIEENKTNYHLPPSIGIDYAIFNTFLNFTFKQISDYVPSFFLLLNPLITIIDHLQKSGGAIIDSEDEQSEKESISLQVLPTCVPLCCSLMVLSMSLNPSAHVQTYILSTLKSIFSMLQMYSADDIVRILGDIGADNNAVGFCGYIQNVANAGKEEEGVISSHSDDISSHFSIFTHFLIYLPKLILSPLFLVRRYAIMVCKELPLSFCFPTYPSILPSCVTGSYSSPLPIFTSLVDSLCGLSLFDGSNPSLTERSISVWIDKLRKLHTQLEGVCVSADTTLWDHSTRSWKGKDDISSSMGYKSSSSLPFSLSKLTFHVSEQILSVFLAISISFSSFSYQPMQKRLHVLFGSIFRTCSMVEKRRGEILGKLKKKDSMKKKKESKSYSRCSYSVDHLSLSLPSLFSSHLMPFIVHSLTLTSSHGLEHDLISQCLSGDWISDHADVSEYHRKLIEYTLAQRHRGEEEEEEEEEEVRLKRSERIRLKEEESLRREEEFRDQLRRCFYSFSSIECKVNAEKIGKRRYGELKSLTLMSRKDQKHNASNANDNIRTTDSSSDVIGTPVSSPCNLLPLSLFLSPLFFFNSYLPDSSFSTSPLPSHCSLSPITLCESFLVVSSITSRMSPPQSTSQALVKSSSHFNQRSASSASKLIVLSSLSLSSLQPLLSIHCSSSPHSSIFTTLSNSMCAPALPEDHIYTQQERSLLKSFVEVGVKHSPVISMLVLIGVEENVKTRERKGKAQGIGLWM
ncbi:hypothetical protein ADUPG1_013441, partial [Aduncisulcus paluster]